MSDCGASLGPPFPPLNDRSVMLEKWPTWLFRDALAQQEFKSIVWPKLKERWVGAPNAHLTC